MSRVARWLRRRLQLAAGKFAFELGQHRRRVAVALTTPETDVAGVPAVAQPDSQHVVAGLDERRHIVRLVLDARVVICAAWRQTFVAYARPINVGLVDA